MHETELTLHLDKERATCKHHTCICSQWAHHNTALYSCCVTGLTTITSFCNNHWKEATCRVSRNSHTNTKASLFSSSRTTRAHCAYVSAGILTARLTFSVIREVYSLKREPWTQGGSILRAISLFSICHCVCTLEEVKHNENVMLRWIIAKKNAICHKSLEYVWQVGRAYHTDKTK